MEGLIVVICCICISLILFPSSVLIFVTMTKLLKLGESIKKRLKSGDSAAAENGEGGSPIASTDEQVNCCAKCEKSWDNVTPKQASVQCCHCVKYFCFGKECANMKKSDMDFVSRDDIFWACFECKMILTGDSQGQNTKLEGEIENLKEMVSEVSGDLKKYQEETKTWAEALFGQDYPVYDPNISKNEAKKIAAQPLPALIQKAVHAGHVDNKKEEQEMLDIRSNIVVYNMPEPKEDDFEKRQEEQRKLVTELFAALGKTATKPKKMFRLGHYKDGDSEAAPRPLKLVLGSQEEAVELMANCRLLKDAPTEIKKYSVSHDLTKTEREVIKRMVAEAKEKSRNSPNWDVKVVGPPWKPVFRSYKKRTPAANNNAAEASAGQGKNGEDTPK